MFYLLTYLLSPCYGTLLIIVLLLLLLNFIITSIIIIIIINLYPIIQKMGPCEEVSDVPLVLTHLT